jgi:hypothetical protein
MTIDYVQMTIDYVMTAHAFREDHTRTLLYGAHLTLPQSSLGHANRTARARTGSCLAFGHRVSRTGTQFSMCVLCIERCDPVNPSRSETERLIIALNEYEAYCWSLRRTVELALSRELQSEICRRAQFALIDLDHPKAKSLAQIQRFDAARDESIRLYSATPIAANAATARLGSSACCS